MLMMILGWQDMTFCYRNFITAVFALINAMPFGFIARTEFLIKGNIITLRNSSVFI